MALDIKKIKSSLNSLNPAATQKTHFWKPLPGKQEIRILPNKFSPENPFVNLKFHYGINGKTYLSPSSFGRPDPIEEFSSKLKKTGDKDDWKTSKKFEPKVRTYLPVLVRGQENEGPKWWGFGKKVYDELVAIVTDVAENGDVTDMVTGRDITVEHHTAAENGTDFPDTKVRVKVNTKPAIDVNNKELLAKIDGQTNILELFSENTYAELCEIMKAWLKTEETDTTEVEDPVSAKEPVVESKTPTVSKSTPKAEPTVKTTKTEDVEATFNELFDEKS